MKKSFITLGPDMGLHCLLCQFDCPNKVGTMTTKMMSKCRAFVTEHHYTSYIVFNP